MSIRAITIITVGTILFTLGCGTNPENNSSNTTNSPANNVTETNNETGGTDAGGENNSTSEINDAGDGSAITEELNGDAGVVTDPDECGTVHTVTTTNDTSNMALYMDFTPENLTIDTGDCVNFEMSSHHNAVEVSQATYDNGGNTALENGFSVNFGETKRIKFDAPGMHYYVCIPHASADMFGTISVQ
mgnify:CR=1 FL=1